MKKAMMTIAVLLVAAMGLAPQVHAQAFKAAMYHSEHGTVQVIAQQQDNSFDLVYRIDEEKYVKINILNEDKRVIFTETFRNRGAFRRPYNLAKLPEGQYTFEVTGSMGTYTQLVTVD